MTADQDRQARKQRADQLHKDIDDLIQKRRNPQKADRADDKSCDPPEKPNEFIDRRMDELDKKADN